MDNGEIKNREQKTENATSAGSAVTHRFYYVFILLLAFGLAYGLLSPATINGDGIGYLKQLNGRSLAPGHLLFLPLARQLASTVPHETLLELVPYFRWLSHLAALLALLLLYDGVRSFYSTKEALFAMSVLGASHAFFRAATEVEVYGVASLFATAAFWCVLRFIALTAARHQDSEVCRREIETEARAPAQTCAPRRLMYLWVIGAGFFCAVSMLFHLTLGLLGLSLILCLARWAPAGRKTTCVLLGSLTMAMVSLPAYSLAISAQGLTSLPAVLSWLRSADHGLPYLPSVWLSVFIALWGVSKSLVYAPYLYQGSWVISTVLGLLGALILLGLFWVSHRALASRRLMMQRRWQPPTSPLLVMLLWSGPLALFALFFFPSDTERWVFLMPALALVLAPAANFHGLTLLLCVVVVNLITVQLPLARDHAPLEHAAAVERLLTPRDLLVSPGHGWEELVGLGVKNPPHLFPLVYFMGRERSIKRAIRQLEQEIQRTFAAGGRVFVARLVDQKDQQGFKELLWFGLDPAEFAKIFASYTPRATTVHQLWKLSARR